MTRRPVAKAPNAALVAMLVTILVAVPAGAAMSAMDVVAQDALAEQRALEELDRLHALPDVLEYVPPAPWYGDGVAEEGPGYEFEAVDNNDLIMSTPSPMAATGTAKVVSLAIEFTDVTHRSTHTINAMQNWLTGSNSMKTYYEEVSYDKLTIDGAAYGWYTANNDLAYYGAPEGGSHDSRNFYQLVREAVLAADPYVDFSKYDTNRDRIIDGVCLVHASQDQAASGKANDIWSKQSVYPGTLRVDGVYLGYYFTVSEYSPVGIYVHEFGHMIGLPDLYDTDYSSIGVGVWDVMASGAWNNYGRTPAHFSAWCKVHVGWLQPTTIRNYVEGRELRYMAGTEGETLKLPTSDSQEYFLLENRYAAGYDRYLPGSGLLIWHIDDGVISQNLRYNRVNNNENHKGVDLEEASGTQDLDTRGSNNGDNRDPWKSDPVGFTPDSTPNSRLYDGTDTKIRVFNISGAGTVMTIDIDFGGDSFAIFLDTLSTIREAGPGEALVYNISVGTRSPVGDTVYLSLKGTHASWGFLASSDRTLVLGPKAIRVVQMKVTPPAGTAKDVAGQVILLARSKEVSSITAELETITVVKQVHLLAAIPSNKTVSVLPGTPKHLDITVTNSGNGVENITLSLEAERAYWGSVTPGRISIGVLDSKLVRVTFSVPLGVMAGEEEPFELTFLSEVKSGGEGGEQTSLVLTLEVPINMVVQEVVSLRWNHIPDEHVLPGGTVAYELTLFNEGNSEVNVSIGYQAPEDWVLELHEGVSVIIPAFGVATLDATLTAPIDEPAGSSVDIDISAARGADFFYSSLHVTVDHLYAVAVYGQAALFVDPGERAVFYLNVTNMGNGNDRVTLGIHGNGWETEVTPNLIVLGAGESDRSRQVQVHMTAPRDAEAYEENTATVLFTSDNGEVTATHEVTLNVNPFTSFEVEGEVVSDLIDIDDPTKQRAIYFVHVDNTGNLEDLFHIGLIGLPDGWTSELGSRMLSVPANKRRMVELSIMAPRGDSPAVAGTIHFRVHVSSELGHSEPVEVPLVVNVAANRGHDIRSLEPTYTVPSGSELTFRVLVVNEGNVRETLVLSAVGEFESYSFEVLELALEPFGQRVVNLTVEMPSVDDDTTVEVQVIATTKDMTRQESTPIPIEVEGRPTTPGPGAFAALVAVTMAAAVSMAATRRRRA